LFYYVPPNIPLQAGMKAGYEYVGGADSLDNEIAQIPCALGAGSISFYYKLS